MATVFKKYNNSKGMTLVEIIVSIAVIGILATLALSVFGTGMFLAVNSGDNTMVNQVASEITYQITENSSISPLTPAAVYSATYNVPTVPTNATVKFNGSNAATIQITGIMVDVNAASDKNTTEIQVFLPN